MRERCIQPTNKDYYNYGGRGILCCDRWAKFRNFREDMGEKPAGTTLDRINFNGNYEPSNCRWADNFTQFHNSRQCKVTEEVAAEIRERRRRGELLKDLVLIYPLKKSMISLIGRGQAWIRKS